MRVGGDLVAEAPEAAGRVSGAEHVVPVERDDAGAVTDGEGGGFDIEPALHLNRGLAAVVFDEVAQNADALECARLGRKRILSGFGHPQYDTIQSGQQVFERRERCGGVHRERHRVFGVADLLHHPVRVAAGLQWHAYPAHAQST